MRVFTLTCNLLAETTYTFETWEAGATHRARAESFQVGGKGINVTRMLNRLGVDSVALYFPGGATGMRCEAWLRQRRIPHLGFRSAAETRTGAVVRTPGRPETTFLGRENRIDTDSIAACASHLDAQRPENLLVLSGSVPDWAQARWDPLRNTLRRWTQQGTLIVDTYGPPLSWLAGLPVAMVKINRREFAGLAAIGLADATADRMPALLATMAASHKVAAWVITDGPNPVWYVERGGRPQKAAPPQVTEVSSTGSGDVFTAGLIFGRYRKGMDLASAVAFALPLASANASHPGVAEFELSPMLGGAERGDA